MLRVSVQERMQAWREADELEGRELMRYGAGSRLDAMLIQPYGCISVDRAAGLRPRFAAVADHTRRDIVRRAISAEEGVLELAVVTTSTSQPTTSSARRELRP
jgi:hypothetical protein